MSNNGFKIGDKVKKLSYAAGDLEEYQTGVIVSMTFDGLLVVEWDNGCICNTHIAPVFLLKLA